MQYWTLFLIAVLFALGGCSSHETKLTNAHSVEHVEEEQELVVDSLAQEREKDALEVTTVPREIALECKNLGMDDMEIPRSEVYLIVDSKRDKVAECLSCETIEKKDFILYDIPENASAACGGWWAGGGDYFYVIVNRQGEVEVYAGWQDEGQMEENDTSFHWELKVLDLE